jgi:hypothetical protein
VYDSLLEALICGDTTVSSLAFPEVYNDLCLYDSDIGKTKLEEQFEVREGGKRRSKSRRRRRRSRSGSRSGGGGGGSGGLQ